VASVVSTPLGYWSGLAFGVQLTSSSTGLDLTTLASAVSTVVQPNGNTQVWIYVITEQTPTFALLTHPYGPSDTILPGTISIDKDATVLTDINGNTYPMSPVQIIVVP
jgi:hypothetical protein